MSQSTKRKQSQAKYAFSVKLTVLKFYSSHGIVKCSWPECEVIDPDMLSIDHVNDDGAEERKFTHTKGGSNLYLRLRKLKYPPGYQTLCHNHQWKKEIMRRREEVCPTI
jgi:hypothetical protein